MHTTKVRNSKQKTHRQLDRPPFECVALLLQGGRALGAYQAGVYQALSEAHLDPDWVAGKTANRWFGPARGPSRYEAANQTWKPLFLSEHKCCDR